MRMKMRMKMKRKRILGDEDARLTRA